MRIFGKLILLVISVQGGIGLAQNTFPAVGNVGIGTTNLSVNGEVLTVNNSSGPYAVRAQGASGNAVLLGSSATTTTAYVQGSSASGSLANLSLNPVGANVGVGTLNPAALLDVYGAGNTSNGTPSIWIGNSTSFNAPSSTEANGTLGFRGNGWINGFVTFYPHKSDGNAYFEVTGQSLNYGDAQTGLLVNGKLGVGTGSPSYSVDVAGQVHTSGGVVFPDGTTQTTAFNPAICGGDYAESIDITGKRNSYEPGDLLAIDPSEPSKFVKSSEAYSAAIAGVYSTRPGTLGRRQVTAKRPDEVPMAVVGIVPAKVSAENGPIRPSDLLVSANTPGYAMKGTDRSRMLGAVVGKAMGSLDSGTGIIEILVTLQ